MELQDVIALDKQYYMNTFGNRIPIMFTGGHGSTVIDSEGNEYIDFLAGIAVNALGYNHPALVDAICKQAQTLLHCSNYFYIEKQAILAKMLCENSCADKVFFANSGAEANEGAFKLIRKYFKDKGEQRYEVISTLNSFHGRTLATVTATGQPKYSAAYSPLPEGFTLVPYGDINAVKAAITPKTAAVLIEVIQGEGGIIEGGQTYLSAVRQLCNETGILLMIDEVQTGMGRTGKLFAHQHYGIEPDIFTTAKALGGGVPIGALMCKDHVSVFGPGDHGSTFGGNPLACAAGVAVMSELTKPGFLDNVAKLGTYFKGKLCALQQKYPSKIVDVRGLGLILGVQFAPDLSIDTVHKAALGKKFILGKAGMNTLRLVPPLVITTAEIDALIDLLDEILKGV